MTKEQVKEILRKKLKSNRLSCWNRGVIRYAYNLVLRVKDGTEFPKDFTSLEDLLLDSSCDWKDFSYSGKAYVYDNNICAKLATPGEKKRTGDGFLNPNKHESWKDVQARALTQASQLIYEIINE